jgi:hypothetical protein
MRVEWGTEGFRRGGSLLTRTSVKESLRGALAFLTLGMAYTKLPKGAEVLVSGVAVVRNMSSEVRLLVNWRWILVCGARGRGKAISIGFSEVAP